MAVDGSLIFDTKVDTKGFTSGTNTIKSQANGLKGALLSLGKTIVVAFGVRQLVRFGKQAIDTASDLQEVQNVVDTAFGDMAYKMEEFAATSIRTFGISKLAAKQTGSTFMAMARGMGIAMDSASNMAISLTGLSADMSSFYNVSQDIASTALKSIFTGETETLKQFGIVMTQANLQTFAYSQGIKQNVSDMDQATITQLRYLYVMQQTSLAQGDFAKTSGSWANQTRILKEQWKEFLGILGTGLIQVLTPVVRFLNTALSYLISFANAVGKVLSTLFGIKQTAIDVGKATTSIGAGSEDAATGLGNMGKAAKKAGKDAKRGTADFDQLNNVTENIADSAGGASDAVSGIGAIDLGTPTTGTLDTSELEGGLMELANKIKATLQPVTEALERFKKSIEPFAKNIGIGLKWFIDNVLMPLGKWTITKLLPAFLDTLGAAIGVLNSVIEVFKPFGLWLWNNFLLPIATWTGGIITDALNGITTGLNNLSNWILSNQETIANAALLIGSFFAAFKIAEFLLWAAPLLAAFAEFVVSGGLVSTILAGLSTALGAVLSPIGILTTIIGLLIVSFADLYSNSESFREAVAELGKTWLEALQPVADFVSGVLADAWDKILKPVIDFFINTLLPNLIDTFKNLWEKVLVPLGTFIGTVLQPIFEILSDILTMLWEEVVLPLAEAIGKTLKEAWDGLYKILNKTIIPVIGGVIEVLQFLWDNVINPIIDVLWDKLKPAFEDVFGVIGDIIEDVQDGFSTLIGFVTDVFTGDWESAWETVSEIFGGIFEDLVGLVKDPINLIIEIINGMISGIVAGVNAVIKALNGINISIPGWVPGLGGNSIGFNLPLVTAPKIPKLATGTVIPPNSEFLALLGDQKKGVNIEAPLDTIVEAFERTASKMNVGGSEMLHVTISLRDKQVFDGIVEMERENYDKTGKPIFVH